MLGLFGAGVDLSRGLWIVESTGVTAGPTSRTHDPPQSLWIQGAVVQTHRINSDLTVINDHLPVPTIGYLPINAFVLHAEQPVVVDTGVSLPTAGSWTCSARSSTRRTSAGSG